MGWDRRAHLPVGLGVALLIAVAAAGAGAVAAAESTATAGSDPDRRTLVGLQSETGSWNDRGAVSLYAGTEPVWRAGDASSYFEVERLADGRVVAAFANASAERCGPHESPCARTGYRVLDPRGSGPPTIDSEHAVPVRTIDHSEVHAVEPLPDGGYAVADMVRERVLVRRDGATVWQWNGSSFYEAPPDPTHRDWLHVNDVDAINDTHLLVSVRNANQVLVLERGRGVVEVINADRGPDDGTCNVARRSFGWLYDADDDGDVRCGDSEVMYNQHNAQWLGDGAVLVADSENHRVVELHRNETTGAWAPAWTVASVGGTALEWPRDADRLPNGNTLITDTQNGRVVEVDRNGTVVWRVDGLHLPYEADRLPAGEPVGAARYGPDDPATAPFVNATNGTASDDEAGVSDREVPVLTTALFALRGQFSVVPAWFEERHLLVAAVGLLAGIVGLAVAVRSRLG